MAMSADMREERLVATKDMATALLGDLQHMRETADKIDPERGAPLEG